MKQMKNDNSQDLPLGLSMVMAQNPYAFECFAKLTTEQKKGLISSTHDVKSTGEMHQLVDNLTSGDTTFTGNSHNSLM